MTRRDSAFQGGLCQTHDSGRDRARSQPGTRAGPCGGGCRERAVAGGTWPLDGAGRWLRSPAGRAAQVCAGPWAPAPQRREASEPGRRRCHWARALQRAVCVSQFPAGAQGGARLGQQSRPAQMRWDRQARPCTEVPRGWCLTGRHAQRLRAVGWPRAPHLRSCLLLPPGP